MDGGETASVRAVDGLGAVDPALWDCCAAPEAGAGGRPDNPFLTHRWLSAFEDSGSATVETGWQPLHLIAEDGAGAPLGVMPLYAKHHSYGEYVFDHGWAHGFERAGGRYYPKLLSATPFTPVAGRRLLVHPDAPQEAAERALIGGAARLAAENGLSSLHVIFCERAERDRMARAGLLARAGQQFHWFNRGYEDFEAFLNSLASRKRKAIRKERARAAEAVEIVRLTGDAIEAEHWDALWTFYQDTGARKWGTPYLTRAFFEIAHERLREDILLIFARRAGRWVAGAMNVIGRDALYGRYWGCVEDHPCLHFELCYYQAIEEAIRRGLSRVEAGAQGEHKLARGYEPVETFSAHWIAHPDFRRAVARFVDAERDMVAEEMALLDRHTPFRKG